MEPILRETGLHYRHAPRSLPAVSFKAWQPWLLFLLVLTGTTGQVLAAGRNRPDIRIAPLQLNFQRPLSSPATPPAASPVEPASRRPANHALRGMTASPHPFEATQPDGSKITMRVRGSASFHWLEDKDGYTVVQQDKTYVYAQPGDDGRLVPSRWVVGKHDPVAAGLVKHTLPSREVRESSAAAASSPVPGTEDVPSPVPARGDVKNIVILLRFANHTERQLPSDSDFNTIFNAPGGSPTLAPSGSVRDVYLQNSYGAMRLNSTVFAWVTLPQPESYYADGQRSLSYRVQEAIIDGLNLADPLVDFAQFDGDRDGFVDAITFIHSGYGAEWGGTDEDGTDYTNRIWSHRWAIPTWTSAEGVRVSDYHISPALWGTWGNQPGHIGVICHETGHFFGLPDLYDGDGGEGIGSWCMMANSWGFSGNQFNPPHFSAWSKIFLGWLTPTRITGPGTYTLPQAESSPSVFRIEQGFPSGEYLLIENRQPSGFDRDIPQGGLAVWHIDENKWGNTEEGYPGQPDWPANGRHYRVALLQADGRFDLERGWGRGDGGDLYHAGAAHEISATTTPNTDAYQNGNLIPTLNRIYNISAAGPTMTFSYGVTPTATTRFTIYNDGGSTLTVNSLALDRSFPGVSWSCPSLPFSVVPGGSQTVSVVVNFENAPLGISGCQLRVGSDDPDENPYPGGVNIIVNNTPPPTLTLRRLDSGQMRLEVLGLPNRVYQIETTVNWQTWTALASVSTGTDGRASSTLSSAGANVRFYRIHNQ